MKKILVTGGVGFIGSNLIKGLKELNFELVSLDDYSTGLKANELDGVQYIKDDILNINNHFEEWDDKNEWLNHNITINDNDYVIFKNFKGYGWGEAVQRLAEILNIEFEKQNIKERVYLINGGVMMEA